MRRFFLAVVLAGGTTVAIFVGTSNDTANRVATCPVRLTDRGLAVAREAGLDLKRNELIRFGVVRRALSDGGLSFDIPPEMDGLRGLVTVKDWRECTIDPAASFPGVTSRWDAGVPFVFPGAASRRCVRAKLSAGLTCLRMRGDGGVYSFGDRNVFPRAEADAPLMCEPCECSATLGEDPEVDL